MERGANCLEHLSDHLTFSFAPVELVARRGILGPTGSKKGARCRHFAPFLCPPLTFQFESINMTNTPPYKLRLGLITATVWKNDSFFSVDFSRSYKDASGHWQSTTSYAHADLLNIAKCAERTENWIARQTNADK